MIRVDISRVRIVTLVRGRDWYGHGEDVGATWTAASFGGRCDGPDHDPAGWCPIDTHEVIGVGLEVCSGR